MTSQWLLPAVLVLIAVIVVVRLRRILPRSRGATERVGSALARRSWQEVRVAVGDYLSSRDFAVPETELASPGGAADQVMTRRNEYYLVRYRHWGDAIVGVEAVRDFHRVMAARHAAGGFLVTSGSFSREAREFVRDREIELISGDQLP